jgi:hypothetical protein
LEFIFALIIVFREIQEFMEGFTTDVSKLNKEYVEACIELARL